MSQTPINITALRTTRITSLNYIISTRKFLSKFGYRLQYSVFKIENSERILNIVSSEIENRFAKKSLPKAIVLIFLE